MPPPRATSSRRRRSRPGPPPPGAGPGLEAAAEALHLSVDELRTKLHGDGGGERLTLAQVAEQQGVPVQSVIDAMVAEATERIDQAVADGDLTAEKAAARKAELVERITQHVNEGLPARGPGGPGRMGPPPLDAAADALGLSPDELRTKLHDEDLTLAEVAEQQGVPVQSVIEAMVADATVHLDQAVAEGRITADQAAERKAHLVERLTTMVNEGPPERGQGGPGRTGAPAGGDEQPIGSRFTTAV